MMNPTPRFQTPAALAAASLLVMSLACGGGRQTTQDPIVPPSPPPAVKPISAFVGSPGGWGAVDGPSAEARFTSPGGLCFDKTGRLLVADEDNGAIRMVDPATGATSTWGGRLAGEGTMDGLLPDAGFAATGAMAPASDGTVYFSDFALSGIRKVDPKGMVTTILPGGSRSYMDGVGPKVRFHTPSGLALDEARGCLYVADDNNMLIRQVNLATNETTTLAGVWQSNDTVDGLFESAHFLHPRTVVKPAEEVLYVGCDDAIRKLDLVTRKVTTLAGTPGVVGFADGVGPQVRFNGISGIALDGLGHLLITEGAYSGGYCGQVLRSLDLATGRVTTVAGTGNDPAPDAYGGILGLRGCMDGIGGAVRFDMPRNIVVDGKGMAYISDLGNSIIRKVDLESGRVSTLAGTRPRVGSADGTADLASFNQPFGLALDSKGNAYVAEWHNNLIRKVTPQGVVSTLAGRAGISGCVDGPGSAATFSNPADLAVDAAGNVFVADTGNHCIRRISSDGAVTVLAGTPGNPGGYADGPGTAAQFNGPEGLVLASDGNLYVADTANNLIRVVRPDGTVSTLAGSGAMALADGTGSEASFSHPCGITEGPGGRLQVADTFNNAIRSIDMHSGAVTTLAGGTRGAADGTGSAAKFRSPARILADPGGFLLVSDYDNQAIRKITSAGVVTTVVGTLHGEGPSLQGIKLGDLPGQVTAPVGLARNADGSILLVTDNCLLRITGIN
jgi:sugar lactone lactonase YvrE